MMKKRHYFKKCILNPLYHTQYLCFGDVLYHLVEQAVQGSRQLKKKQLNVVHYLTNPPEPSAPTFWGQKRIFMEGLYPPTSADNTEAWRW